MNRQSIRILLIEGDSVEAELIREQIAQSAHFRAHLERVMQLGDGIEKLRFDNFGLVLLDLNLPDGRGLENLRRVKRAAAAVPVIILTNVEGITHES